ncbi:MAG: hypothetical protein ACRCZY_02985 [Phocaeicola sp.]
MAANTRLVGMRDTHKNEQLKKYIDSFLFQTFTSMAFFDAKTFAYKQHVVDIEGKDYIW